MNTRVNTIKSVSPFLSRGELCLPVADRIQNAFYAFLTILDPSSSASTLSSSRSIVVTVVNVVSLITISVVIIGLIIINS